MRLQPTQGNEDRGRPRVYAGEERFSAPVKAQLPIMRLSAGIANSRAKQAAEKRAEATSKAQGDV